MKIKDLVPIIKCNKHYLIKILAEDEKDLFSFNYEYIEDCLKYFMDREVDHISIGIEDEMTLLDTKIDIVPTLKIFIKDNNRSSAIDFIKNEIAKLFEDKNKICFWPSNKNHKLIIIVNNGAKCIAYGTYELTSYVDIEDFASSCRWAILECLLKNFKYVTHRVDNDKEYILSVEVEP